VETRSQKSSPQKSSLSGIFGSDEPASNQSSRSPTPSAMTSSIVFGDGDSSITGSRRQRNPNANSSSIVFDDEAQMAPKPFKKQFPNNPNNADTSKLLHPPGAPPREAPKTKKNVEHEWTTQSLGTFLNTETVTRGYFQLLVNFLR
jgi:hypothetical protein